MNCGTPLNANQEKAVSWNNGPMLVLAGPGSGKTTVLTTRVARLLQELPHASVLALTFTTRAATEMRERVEQLLASPPERAFVGTFHAFAADLLRQHGSHLGLRPDFTLLTREEDRIDVLEDAATSAHHGGSRCHALFRLDRTLPLSARFPKGAINREDRLLWTFFNPDKRSTWDDVGQRGKNIEKNRRVGRLSGTRLS